MSDLLTNAFGFWVGLAIVVMLILNSSVKFVPQNMAYVVERFGKFRRTMIAGLNFVVPFIDKVAYKVSLKEMAMDVPSQQAITKDNITLTVDGVLYMKVTLLSCRQLTMQARLGVRPVCVTRSKTSHRL